MRNTHASDTDVDRVLLRSTTVSLAVARRLGCVHGVRTMIDYTVHPRRTSSLLIIAVFLLFNLCYHAAYFSHHGNPKAVRVPLHAPEVLSRCRALNLKPGPPSDFYDRDVSDRFVRGTKPVLIRNATVWTGRVQGLEIIHGDVLLVGGIIAQVGHISNDILSAYSDLVSLDAHG